MTNFDSITASPEALARFYEDNVGCETCFLYGRCIARKRGSKWIYAFLEWLQEESE